MSGAVTDLLACRRYGRALASEVRAAKPRMRKVFLVSTLLCLLFVRGPGWAQTVCPSQTLNCSSKGSLADFSGSFACTVVQAGVYVQKVNLALLTSDGNGNISGKSASDKNDPDTIGTFKDFSNQAVSATYCVNSDDTGYLFPTSGLAGCPLAFVIDRGKQEVRLLSSASPAAILLTCRKR